MKKIAALVCAVVMIASVCATANSLGPNPIGNSDGEWVKNFESGAWTDSGGGSQYYDAQKGSNVWKVDTNGAVVQFWSSQEGTGLAIAHDRITGKYRISWEFCVPTVDTSEGAQTLYMYLAFPSNAPVPWASLANFRILEGELCFYTPTVENVWNYVRTGFMLTSGKWYQCDAIVDLDQGTTTYYVDGQEIYEAFIPSNPGNYASPFTKEMLELGYFHWWSSGGQWVTVFAEAKTPAGKPILVDNITIGAAKENEISITDTSIKPLSLAAGTKSIDFTFKNSVDKALLTPSNITVEKFDISDPLHKNPTKLEGSALEISNARVRGVTVTINEGIEENSIYKVTFGDLIKDVNYGAGFTNPEQIVMAQSADKIIAGVRFEALGGKALRMENGVVSPAAQVIKLIGNENCQGADFEGAMLVLESSGQNIIPASTSFDNGIFTMTYDNCLLPEERYSLKAGNGITNAENLSFQTGASVFEASNLRLVDSSGSKISRWEQLIDGPFYVKMKIENVASENTVYLICAQYLEDGRLHSIHMESIPIPSLFSGDVSTNELLTVEDNVTLVKAFAWDGINTMKPLFITPVEFELPLQ